MPVLLDVSSEESKLLASVLRALCLDCVREVMAEARLFAVLALVVAGFAVFRAVMSIIILSAKYKKT